MHERFYGRGIRRRLAPMLGHDRRGIEMAYSLQPVDTGESAVLALHYEAPGR